MAKRPQQPERHMAQLDASKIPPAIAKLERRIKELGAATPANKDELSALASSLSNKVNDTLADIFGLGSTQYERAQASASRFLVGRGVMTPRGIPWEERLEDFNKGRTRSISLLQSEIELLKERLEDGATDTSPGEVARGVPALSPDEVFVVHGQDEAARESVARFLSAASLRPIILHEQPNGGKTLIEKFEGRAANIGFAVVLLTPDDVGGRVGGEMRPRARQNVVAELFYFMGKLGRERVCALKKGDIEIPSDIAGLVYTEMDSAGAWKMALLRELKEAGFEVRADALLH